MRNFVIAMLIGMTTPILIWVGAGVAFRQKARESKLLKQALPDLACSINTDCPPGYVCMAGRCVPQEA